jgi:AmiR/NasT family two-component response regulator
VTDVRSRAAIEQSRGLLMAEHGVSPEEAFQMLVRLAQSEHLTLRATAEHLIQQARRPWN